MRVCTQKEESSDQKKEKKRGIQKPQAKQINEDKRIQLPSEKYKLLWRAMELVS